ncbi:microfibrillar-associated protein 1-like [Olea europaea var. sylvestris]|uniref:microfibrillar-associated protein 1-like n=1 Tax=Olea europaea var. sylvestris TaxID=158386 RepID=UPI000C1CF435|nr:microfibrillar-associated protein 1-like [Olea europaea var. sylvestris]
MENDTTMTIIKLMNQDLVRLDRFDRTNFTEFGDFAGTNVLGNMRKPQDRKNEAPSRFTKDKIEKDNNKGSSEKPRLVRCHECPGIGHYRNECPSYKKNQRKGKGKALVVSLTDNESETSDRQESSSSDTEGNYMAFVATVKSESDKESDKVEEEQSNDNSVNENEDEDDIDLQEAYQQLFKESLKIKKVDKSLLKKLDELEREKEKLGGKLQESLKSGSELKCVNEKLEDKVKSLTSELEKSNAHLRHSLVELRN